MATMHPKQAVEIARKLINECTTDSASTLFGVLAPQHIQAILFLAETVDEVWQAKNVQQVMEKLFERGIIRAHKGKRNGKKKGGSA